MYRTIAARSGSVPDETDGDDPYDRPVGVLVRVRALSVVAVSYD